MFTKSDLLSMNFTYLGCPFVQVTTVSSINTTTLDIPYRGAPFSGLGINILNFPTSPSLNDTYSNWIWKATSWKNINRTLPNNTNTLNFPSSPSLNDVYTVNGLSWKWNGTSWKTHR